MGRAINIPHASMLSRNSVSGHGARSGTNGYSVKQPRAADAPDCAFLDSFGVLMEFAPNSEIYTLDDPADHIYKVVSGAVRTCRMLDDGRRHIGAFYLRGDVFGFESGSKHTFSCEAVCHSTIRMISCNALDRANGQGRSNGMQLLSIAAREMHRAQMQSSLLVKTASERVASFLLQMSAYNVGPATFQLPMGRQDIADHLGLTIETVSRIFTQMEESGVILRTPLRHILVRDKQALEQMDV